MGEEKEKDLKSSLEAEKLIEEDKAKEDKTEKVKKKKKNKSEEKIKEIETKLNEFKDKYYRNLADMENYKKRMAEDLKKERKYAGYSLANRIIDSITIFNQALNMETEDPNLKNFLYGFKMIDDMIYNALKEEGVSLIDTKVGDEFDPTKDEAMDKEYDPTKPLNTVLKVVKKGYMFKDRILRPSMVVINIQPKEEIEINIEKTNSEDTENKSIENNIKE